MIILDAQGHFLRPMNIKIFTITKCNYKYDGLADDDIMLCDKCLTINKRDLQIYRENLDMCRSSMPHIYAPENNNITKHRVSKQSKTCAHWQG